MSGFLFHQRDRFNHALFRDEVWCRGYAWDWMVAQAAWKPTKQDILGKIVAIERGQFSTSVRAMADRFKWSKSAVHRFLTRLQTDTMIGTDSGTGRLVITICNYDKYQQAQLSGGTQIGTGVGTRAGHERDTKEEREEFKKVEREGKPSLVQSRFAEFWDAYPHRNGAKKGRKPSEAKYAAAVKAGTSEQDIIDGAKRAALDRQVIDGFARNPETWLNQAGWKDEIETNSQARMRGSDNDKPSGQGRLTAFIAGASGAPRVDSWPDSDPSQPLLARR